MPRRCSLGLDVVPPLLRAAGMASMLRRESGDAGSNAVRPPERGAAQPHVSSRLPEATGVDLELDLTTPTVLERVGLTMRGLCRRC
jgi:hypothetical protein